MSSWAKAFVFSVAKLASAIVFASYAPALSQARQSGFMIASNGSSFVWRVNTFTGEVSYCSRRDDSKDPKVVRNRAPYCSKSTPAVAQ